MTTTTAPAQSRRLIGLVGRARSGKDTFARFLVEDRGYTRYAFADPLKAAALDVDPLVFVEVDERGPLREAGFPVGLADPGLFRLSQIVEAVGWEEAKRLREVRRFLQQIGVAMRDHVDRDLWVRATLDRALAHGGPVVITDVRFPNEAVAIRDAGGTLVRIVRPDREAISTGAEHVSEIALDGFPTHYEVDNSGTLGALADSADLIARLVEALTGSA